MHTSKTLFSVFLNKRTTTTSFFHAQSFLRFGLILMLGWAFLEFFTMMPCNILFNTDFSSLVNSYRKLDILFGITSLGSCGC